MVTVEKEEVVVVQLCKFFTNVSYGSARL